MKNLLLIILCCLAWNLSTAQTYIFEEDQIFPTHLIYTLNNGYFYPGNTLSWANVSISTMDNRIYTGYSTSRLDLLFTLKGNQLCREDSDFSSDVLYTIKEGKIYRGDSNMNMDILFTYDRGAIFRGDSNFIFDIVCTVDGPISNTEIFGLLFALEEL